MVKNKQSIGGKARAASLTAKQRSEIAKKAAEARWKDSPPIAVKSGDLALGDIVIQCAVLPDETRVLSERAVTKAFGGKRGGAHWRRKKAGDPGANLPVFMSARNISSLINNDLRENLSAPIPYMIPGSSAIAHGINAELLPDICVALMDMQDKGELHPSQNAIANQAKILHRGLAKVGIIGLVDEATGYQELRDKRALEAILDKFLRKELAAWAKKFPDEFYKQIFRLKNWPWNDLSSKRPSVVGKYTNDLVYERLVPELLSELERKNPNNSKGRRKSKHHQWLSDDLGNPALAQHLHALIGLMRASTSWRQFKSMVDRAFPKKFHTVELDFGLEEDSSNL
ncbi:MAG: P63C domain-containing protein [Gammaproteobacteria bacterium]|nr:P63C domain-containing protein [Gammaproteobacteria bacterium]